MAFLLLLVGDLQLNPGQLVAMCRSVCFTSKNILDRSLIRLFCIVNTACLVGELQLATILWCLKIYGASTLSQTFVLIISIMEVLGSPPPSHWILVRT